MLIFLIEKQKLEKLLKKWNEKKSQTFSYNPPYECYEKKGSYEVGTIQYHTALVQYSTVQ